MIQSLDESYTGAAKETMAEALGKRNEIKPLKAPDTPTMRIEFTNNGETKWAAMMPWGCNRRRNDNCSLRGKRYW